MVPLTAAVAAGGIIIGAIELTGLAGKFTLLLFQLSGGLLVPSLLLAGVVLILLGTGMPTTATYIMGVALLAPVFVGKFGLPVIEVHMFMLFYASLSAITPPVAVAAFAAAAIAGANPFKLTPYACKLVGRRLRAAVLLRVQPGHPHAGRRAEDSLRHRGRRGAGGHRFARPARLSCGSGRSRSCCAASFLLLAALPWRYRGCAVQYAAMAAAIGLYVVLMRAARSVEAIRA